MYINTNDLKNYRPISNLSFLSKFTERIITDRLLSHLFSHNLMSNFQSAYRKFHYCETALLHVRNDSFISLDASHSTALLLLELSAAFETIDHRILLNRLKHWFGVSSLALNLLSSFRFGRSNVKSNPHLLEYDVPQGSVLGPLLYSPYTTPLLSVISNHPGIQCRFYADDSQIYLLFSLKLASLPFSTI